MIGRGAAGAPVARPSSLRCFGGFLLSDPTPAKPKSLTVRRVLESAIRLEERSAALYASAAERVTVPGARALLADLAAEERRHRALLEAARDDESLTAIGAQDVPGDAGWAELLVGGTLGPDADLQDVLLFAAQREHEAVLLYERLGAIYAQTAAAPLLAQLVREERAHKHRLEREYEDLFLADN